MRGPRGRTVKQSNKPEPVDPECFGWQLAKLPFEPGFEIAGLDLVMLKSARPHSV